MLNQVEATMIGIRTLVRNIIMDIVLPWYNPNRFKEKMWKLFSKQSAGSTEAVRYSTTQALL